MHQFHVVPGLVYFLLVWFDLSGCASSYDDTKPYVDRVALIIGFSLLFIYLSYGTQMIRCIYIYIL